MSKHNAGLEENAKISSNLGAILRAGMGLLLLVPFAVGCASMTSLPTSPPVGGAGPGTVFATLDAAVLDALAWSYHDSLQEPKSSRRSRAGTVRLVAEGYTYDTPAVASSQDRHRVSYPVPEDAVAHFRMNPETGTDDERLERALEVFSARDRDLVDRHDAQHRPLYMLTPSLKIRSYAGKATGPRLIARLNRERGTDGVVVSIVQAD